MLRLLPSIEKNFNSVELDPRGAGKSFVYQQMSPYCHLIRAHRRPPQMWPTLRRPLSTAFRALRI